MNCSCCFFIKFDFVFVSSDFIFAIYVQPFICHAMKLQKIFDLIALNEQRKRLAGARKLTIFIKEEIFLKWLETNSVIVDRWSF